MEETLTWLYAIHKQKKTKSFMSMTNSGVAFLTYTVAKKSSIPTLVELYHYSSLAVKYEAVQ